MWQQLQRPRLTETHSCSWIATPFRLERILASAPPPELAAVPASAPRRTSRPPRALPVWSRFPVSLLASFAIQKGILCSHVRLFIRIHCPRPLWTPFRSRDSLRFALHALGIRDCKPRSKWIGRLGRVASKVEAVSVLRPVSALFSAPSRRPHPRTKAFAPQHDHAEPAGGSHCRHQRRGQRVTRGGSTMGWQQRQWQRKRDDVSESQRPTAAAVLGDGKRAA